MEKNKHLIIVVDDDEEDQKLVTMALNQEIDSEIDSFEIALVSSPEEMIKKLKEKEIKDQYSPIVLLDIKMLGKDGFDALKMIREDCEIKYFPVVVLSSTSSEEDILKSYRLGANSFILKKIEFEELIKDMVHFKKYWLKTVKKP